MSDLIALSDAAALPLPPSPTTPSPTYLQVPPSPQQSTHSLTQTPSVQPHASFFHQSRSGDMSVTTGSMPLPSSLLSTSPPGVTSPGGAILLATLNRQPSNASVSASDFSSLAARRANSAIKHSREPLLPIGVGQKSPTSPTFAPVDPPSPSPSASAAAAKMRNSFERLLRRGTAAVAPTSPTSVSPQPSPSPRQARFATTDLDMPSPRTPRSQNTHFVIADAQRQRSPAPSIAAVAQFSALPPPGPTPFVPYISTKTGKPERNYEGYPSHNKFFLGGRILTGGDTIIPFILSFMMVLGIAGTWFATTAVWWWHNESPAVAAIGAYLCLITISSMLATALRDPGILPRGLDPDPPYAASTSSDDSPRLPLPRDLCVGDSYVRVKYCTTCKTYRPPRSSHCKTCDNCVDGCDHHCQWVNNCVGRRNYTSFITFIVVASITLALVIITSAIHLADVTRQTHISFGGALRAAPGSVVVFILGNLIIWPLMSLLAFHVKLLFYNITTIEHLRNKVEIKHSPEPLPPNAFSLGRWYRNVAYLLCRPQGYSWIAASEVRMEDKREINPGARWDAE
ncbi:DHHC palmitoyltransferase-domain-containing protein [Hysterangium stoloniferum]|nr:DHHC palmitoyltransferase-domain-containing protein [Hysterangium stoloniferum]